MQSNDYNLGLMISFCTSVSVCALCFGASDVPPLPRPPLPLSAMRLRVIPVIVVVSPSLYLRSRSRLSANSSSSSSWLQQEAQDQDLLLCCWAPGPRPPQPREAWSNQASSESAVVQTHWLVFDTGPVVQIQLRFTQLGNV